MTRTLVIGDVHGCFNELMRLFDAAQLSDADRVVSVGDLVDRGPDPGRVVAWFRTRPNAVVLMGNHERKHVRGVLTYSQQITKLQLGASYDEVVAWMRGLPYYGTYDGLDVVHAFALPGLALAEQPEQVLCGSTSGEELVRRRLGDEPWYGVYDGPRPIAFGHHVVGHEPLVIDDRVYGLDTGACHGQRLTALIWPERRIVSVPAARDYWAETRRAWQLPVLQARAWDELRWADLDAELAARRSADPAVQAYLERIGGWASTLRKLIALLRERVIQLADRMHSEHGDGFTRAAANHPAKALLFAARRGRLDDAMLVRVAATPRRTIELLRAVGAEAELPVTPPNRNREM